MTAHEIVLALLETAGWAAALVAVLALLIIGGVELHLAWSHRACERRLQDAIRRAYKQDRTE